MRNRMRHIFWQQKCFSTLNILNGNVLQIINAKIKVEQWTNLSFELTKKCKMYILNEFLRKPRYFKQRLKKLLTERTMGKGFKLKIEIVTFAIINLSFQTQFFFILVINSLHFKCCCKLFFRGARLQKCWKSQDT